MIRHLTLFALVAITIAGCGGQFRTPQTYTELQVVGYSWSSTLTAGAFTYWTACHDIAENDQDKSDCDRIAERHAEIIQNGIDSARALGVSEHDPAELDNAARELIDPLKALYRVLRPHIVGEARISELDQ